MTTLAGPCILCDQLSRHHPACPDYEPPPRYNEYCASEGEARLVHVLLKLAQGWAPDKLPPFPGDRKPYAGPSGFAKGHEVKEAYPIAAFAGRFTALAYTGPGRLKGRCPLHTERTPSFYVYEESGRWQCFGACAEGGDVFKLGRRLIEMGKW